MHNKKIKTVEELRSVVKKHKKNKLKIVMCHGAFDIMHFGHIEHFTQAKKLGDILIVSVTKDEFIKKGPKRPFFNIDIRCNTLAALELVDYVVISDSAIAVKNILTIEPSIYCKGSDYKIIKKDITGNIKKEISSVRSVGGKIAYTDGKTFSSSHLINIFSDTFSKDQKKFLNLIKSKYALDYIEKQIKSFMGLKILTLGELIIDEYVFCKAIGKSSKEPMLVLKELFTEKYIGGIGSIANHLSDFTNHINLFSLLGSDKNSMQFVKKNLNKKIKLIHQNKLMSPTIVKKRFIDNVDKKKLLGVYLINDDPIDFKEESKIIANISSFIDKMDVVLVADYGHGMISKNIANNLVKKSKFLTVNSQINSFNRGNQKVDKFKKTHCLILNEAELRHDLRDSYSPLKTLAKNMYKKIKYNKLIITSGSNGANMFSKRGLNSIHCPAFADKIIDKVGSGDTMLAIISMCLKKNLPDELTLFLGSVAAAKSVETIGNSESINKVDLIKTITHMLK